jgi:hypothetical protein
MIFTPTVWDQVNSGSISVSAAPIPPTKLAENSRYVFALPARYNYAFPKGWEEVDQIMKSNRVSTNPVFEVKQDGGYVSAELWFAEDLNTTASDDWTIKQAQGWLDRNKYYLTGDQISVVQDWIKTQAARDDIEANHPSTVPGYFGYKLYSPSLEEANKGNYDVWFWTTLQKIPEGEITNWEPTILAHWGSNPEEIYKQIFDLVQIPCPQDNAK